jgi:hypothetical protein
MSGFMTHVTLSSFLIAGAVVFTTTRSNRVRRPASMDPFELQVQNLSLPEGGRIRSFDNVFLRATFDNTEVFEFGRGEKVSLNAGENRHLDLKIDVDPKWIRNDELNFKLEVVKEGFAETVLFRCMTVSKDLSVYNRSYQCSVPGEQEPVLTYRVARKGSFDPAQSLAQLSQ